jgi:hypothetical protein
MREYPRLAATALTASGVPRAFGVYAWFRAGEPVYAGRAIGVQGLRERVWKNHMATGSDLSRSSFRRNVCEHLGIADTTVTKARPTRLSVDDVTPVNDWIRACEVTWVEFDAPEAAKDFERMLLREWMPPLSRR